MGYTVLTNQACQVFYGEFNSLEEAKEDCSHDAKCSGVYDLFCDGSSELSPFNLCVIRFPYEDDQYGSCIYDKTGLNK